jgi:hypothetical protein
MTSKQYSQPNRCQDLFSQRVANVLSLFARAVVVPSVAVVVIFVVLLAEAQVESRGVDDGGGDDHGLVTSTSLLRSGMAPEI